MYISEHLKMNTVIHVIGLALVLIVGTALAQGERGTVECGLVGVML